MISGLNILPCRANWAAKVTVGSMFLTNQKRESVTGLFSRDSGRDFGQRKISFSLLPDRAVRRTWDAFREVNPPGTVIGIPMWCDEGATLSAAAASGSTSLTVAGDTFIDWRSEGVLWYQPDPSSLPLVEGVQFTGISGSTFTLASATVNAFPAGTELLPLMQGHQIDEYSEDALSPETSQLTLAFDEELAQLTGFSVGGLPSALTYLGVPVLPLIVEWSTPPKLSTGKGTHYVATGLNAEAIKTLRTYPRQTISHTVGLDGLEDRAVLWAFFHARRGRWDRFWLPALKDELSLAANVGASDTTLTLANYSDFVLRYQLGGDLRQFIFLTDGFNFWIRQVINLSGGTNAVTIDSPLGTSLTMGAAQIGLLTLVQFAHDDIEIDCQAPVVATCALSFTELEQEYVEVVTSGTTNGTRVGQELQPA